MSSLEQLRQQYFNTADLSKEASEQTQEVENVEFTAEEIDALSGVFGEMIGQYASMGIEATQEKLAAAMSPFIEQNYELEADKALAKSMETARLQAIVKAQFAGAEIGKVK